MRNELHLGDCLTVMRELDECSVSAIITDPPYGLRFMSADWDRDVPAVDVWRECLRVAKPGAHLLAFGGTRTWHRLACAIEDAGWEIRDTLMWLYTSGFPKSHNLALAVDKLNGAPNRGHAIARASSTHPTTGEKLAPGEALARYEARTDAGKRWEAYGSALKPAWEPVICAMKPMDGNYARNAEKWGVAGINIDAGRIEDWNIEEPHNKKHKKYNVLFGRNKAPVGWESHSAGRWPANVLLDAGAANDMGANARYFFVSKHLRERGEDRHLTQKPLDLMIYLCRMFRPPDGGVTLDPFAGSGTTLVACKTIGLDYIGIEIDPDYHALATRRLANTQTQGELL